MWPARCIRLLPHLSCRAPALTEISVEMTFVVTCRQNFNYSSTTDIACHHMRFPDHDAYSIPVTVSHMPSIMMMPLLNKLILKGLDFALSVAQSATCRDSHCQRLDRKRANWKPHRRASTCRDHGDIHALPAWNLTHSCLSNTADVSVSVCMPSVYAYRLRPKLW